MQGEVIADLLAGHAGYRVIQRLPGIGPVLAAGSSPRSATSPGHPATRLCRPFQGPTRP